MTAALILVGALSAVILAACAVSPHCARLFAAVLIAWANTVSEAREFFRRDLERVGKSLRVVR